MEVRSKIGSIGLNQKAKRQLSSKRKCEGENSNNPDNLVQNVLKDFAVMEIEEHMKT